MYVCLCSGVTDGQIRSCVEQGTACSMEDLSYCLGVGTGCGSCASFAKSLLDEVIATAAPSPQLAAAA